MICFAVIDTNVLVSALLSSKEDTATVQVVRKLLSGEIVPLYSKEIINEYRNVLEREKFGFSKSIVEYLLAAIIKFGIRVEPSFSGIILPDMKDLPFIVTARELLDILRFN